MIEMTTMRMTLFLLLMLWQFVLSSLAPMKTILFGMLPLPHLKSMTKWWSYWVMFPWSQAHPQEWNTCKYLHCQHHWSNMQPTIMLHPFRRFILLCHQAVMFVKQHPSEGSLWDQDSQDTGQIMVQHVVPLHDIQLPEFDENRQITEPKELSLTRTHVDMTW